MPRRRNWAAWLGLGLGLLGVTSFFAWVILGLGPRVLRDTALVNLALVGLGLGASVIGVRRAVGRAPTHRGRVLAPVLAALNLGVAVWFLLLLFRFSALPDPIAAPRVGEAAPAFSLTDHTGAALELAALRGRNVLLVFYRGHW